MKISINKSAKRVLSIALALVMLVGTLFTANVGVNITADAATDPTVEKTVIYWDGSSSTAPTTTDSEGNYIIENPAQLHYIANKIGPTNSTGKTYKVADNMIFVLQPSTVITDLDAFKALDVDGVKSFFESADGKVNWLQSRYPSVFNGNFDGNGVEIYGLYSDGAAISGQSAGSESSALFPNVDGGTSETKTTLTYNSTEYQVATDEVGITFKNFKIQGSYVKGIRRVGIIYGTTQWYVGGAYVDGKVNVDGCVVANNYVVGIGTSYTAGDGTAVTQSRTAGEMGVLIGATGNDPAQISNCLVYGNKGEFKTNETDTTATSELCLASGNNNYTRKTDSVQIFGSLRSSVIIDTALCSNCAHVNYCASVYTNSTPPHANITQLASADAAKGIAGRMNMGGLPWADVAENADDGSTYWYYQENDYPTPIRPASDAWQTVEVPSIWGGSAASSFASGSGTEDDPYIIKTPEQLYLALSLVTDSTNSVAGGIQSSEILKQGSTTEYVPVYTPYYYKVADGVEALYLNNIYGNESLTAIKELVASSSAKAWAPGKSFVGNLDGNGVTIYGMYNSSGTGLVYKLDGSSTVKNFNFDSCYATSSGNSALITTNLGSYSNDSTLINVANISVRNSYIATSRVISLTETAEGSGLYQYNPGAAGIISTANTAENLTISNCLYDGHSCERAIGDGSEATIDMIGGIISGGNGMNNVTLNGCVSLGAPAVDEVYVSGKEVFYNRYDKNQGFQVFFYNCYSDVTTQITTAYPDSYAKLDDIVRVSQKDAYEMIDMPLLQWNKQWQLKTFDTRTIPMPLGSYSGGDEAIIYSNAIANCLNGVGAVSNSGVIGSYGKYGWESKLAGSGTEEDPFLITTALELAQAIGSGGVHYHNPYYYRLTCDIDLTDSTWIDQVSIGTNYIYVPFEGTIDGAGHTITGLAAVDTAAAGFIPVLNGGTVKNLHFRDCYAGSSGYAGIIAGEVKSGTITGCSVEGSTTVGTSSTITGNWIDGAITYSFIADSTQAIYADSTGLLANLITAPLTSETDDDGNVTVTADSEKVAAVMAMNTTDNTVWYVGGASNSIPRHINFAKAHTVTDVYGDGVVDEYETNDLVSLRNYLLDETGFDKIYGDVNRDGTTNISDLVILRREIADDYNNIKDGFWRNVELGKVEIYYDENDNYDFARKLQLYLESLYDDLGVKKYTADTVVVGTESGAPSGDAYVSIKTDTSLTYDQYKIEFDSTNLIVTISGGSFTAVEEAVNEFIQNCDINKANAGVYTTDAKSIDTTVKGRKWVDINLDGVEDENEYLYYAWGDEFDDDKNTGSFDTATWEIRNYKYEETVETAGQSASEVTASSRFHNLTSPAISAIDDLWDVQDGKLTIWRGIDADNYISDYSWGYKSVDLPDGETSDFGIAVDSEDIYVDPGIIQTSKSMLFKQGYSEMRASLPSDGHAFPAWWFYNGVQASNNTNMTNRSLYSKVYKLNNTTNNTFGTHWDGTTNTIDPTNLATYKYQMPQAYLEFDIVEFMQAGSGTQYTQSGNTRTGLTTGDWRDFIQLTIHKYYNQHASGGNLYIPDWSTGGFLSGTNSSGTDWYGMSQDTFVNTAGSNDYIHRFNPDTTISNHPYTVTTGSWFWEDETATSASYSVDQAITNGNLASGKTVTDTYNYGFYWTVNGSAYDLLVFVDMDDDGSMEASELIFKIDETTGHEYDDPTWGNTSASSGSDAAVWNQYAYMLLDNAFYTSNPYGTATRTTALSSWGSETGVTPYADLLTQETGNGTGGASDKTTFDIEYVRVYQEDGKRDIVTPETEDFNTNSHFGY